MSNFGPELSLPEILEILRTTAKSNVPERADFFSKHKEEFLDAIERCYLVTVVEGREFYINYEGPQTVFVKPVHAFSFVPCARLSVTWLAKGE